MKPKTVRRFLRRNYWKAGAVKAKRRKLPLSFMKRWNECVKVLKEAENEIRQEKGGKA